MSSNCMQPGSSSPKPGGSRDVPLSQQMKQNVRKMNDLVCELQQDNRHPDHLNAQMKQLNKEREGILRQLQQEMSNYVTIQEKFQEQEKNMQLIIQELEVDRFALLDELSDKDVSIDDLSEKLDRLNGELNDMSEDITCPICMSQWEAEGVSLRCGHLFGNRCIRRALRASRHCPICMKWANPADVRKIYGRTGKLVSDLQPTLLQQQIKNK